MSMDALMDFALAFLQASVTCVASAAVLLALLAQLRRRWPGMASQRLVWMAAMAAAAVAFVLALWPAPASLRVLPAIEVARPAPVTAPLPVDAAPELDAGGGDDGGLPLAAAPAPRWLLALSGVWLLCYGAGLGLAVVRLAQGRAALRGLLACATPLDARALAVHPGFLGVAGKAPAVLESTAPVSPMLAGLVRPVLLLPRHLRTFDTAQQQLIVAHELAHWQRRDHLWLHASLLLQTVFWFNPALKALAGRLAHAQELGCDRHVLAHRPAAIRRDYAAALVAQLKVQQGAANGLAAPFGGAGVAALGERIRQLRLPDLGGSTRLAAAGKAGLLACCVAVIGAGVSLQPAFAWRAPAAVPGLAEAAENAGLAGLADPAGPAGAGAGGAGGAGGAAPASGLAADGPLAAVALPVWQAPLARVKVNSGYGPRPVRPAPQANRFHHGVDLSARRGTPLLAPADGIVLESTDLYQGQEKFGKVIVIDHGGGLQSMYAHLDQRTVRAGDAVTAGQPIGKTGNTGKTTGPHLHFEVVQHGQRIDPQRLIAALRAH